MTLKYARMENLIPPLSVNPLIDKIVDMELKAHKEMLSRYPNICGRGRPLEETARGKPHLKRTSRELEDVFGSDLRIALQRHPADRG